MPAHQMNWCTSALAASGIIVDVNFSSSLFGSVSTAAAVMYSRMVRRSRDASLNEGPTVCHRGGGGSSGPDDYFVRLDLSPLKSPPWLDTGAIALTQGERLAMLCLGLVSPSRGN